MKIVKGDKALKSIWSAGRRAITPKVGQLTNDANAIMRIVSVLGSLSRYHDAIMILLQSQEILNIVRPAQPHPPPVYIALLSSLAKAILRQAETEVTAEK